VPRWTSAPKAATVSAELPPGVVTRLDLRLHPVGPELLCGFLAFPRERAAEVARVYRDFMAGASD
jgi:hypothetical protein